MFVWFVCVFGIFCIGCFVGVEIWWVCCYLGCVWSVVDEFGDFGIGVVGVCFVGVEMVYLGYCVDDYFVGFGFVWDVGGGWICVNFF